MERNTKFWIAGGIFAFFVLILLEPKFAAALVASGLYVAGGWLLIRLTRPIWSRWVPRIAPRGLTGGGHPFRPATAVDVRFDDVAGVEGAKVELAEIVDLLMRPDRYVAMGARIPKGVLLSGPPGTGKTLLARAVAGEAGVPFFSISGSEFVEMFVGVGASRIRVLFAQAKKSTPCIVFIDEIDALGKQRGTSYGGGADEREQTLNQLLVEMDGFGINSGIIVLAATNRADVLDPALLRAGRFDRKIVVTMPNVQARRAILEVHSRNKPLDRSVDLTDVAERADGLSGADLEVVLNEAALAAVRANKRSISEVEIEHGIAKVREMGQIGGGKEPRQPVPFLGRALAEELVHTMREAE